MPKQASSAQDQEKEDSGRKRGRRQSQSEPAPPSYADAIRSTFSRPADLQAALSEIVESELTPIGGADPDDVARLRRFFVFTLHLDYTVCGPGVSMGASDDTHFLQLAHDMHRFRLSTSAAGTRPEGRDAGLFGSYFWHNVRRPAIALGIPPDDVLVSIVRYGRYRDCNGTYGGCLGGVMHDYGFRRFAIKLYRDRNLIIPKVMDAEQAAPVLEALDKEQNMWFQSFDGFYCCMVDAPGASEVCVGRQESWDLTSRAKSYLAEQTLGITRKYTPEAIKESLDRLEAKAEKDKKAMEEMGGKCYRGWRLGDWNRLRRGVSTFRDYWLMGVSQE